MHNAFRVRVLQRTRNLAEDLRKSCRGQGTPPQQRRLERLPREQFHDEVGKSAFFAVIRDANDVLATPRETGSYLGLEPEPGGRRRGILEAVELRAS